MLRNTCHVIRFSLDWRKSDHILSVAKYTLCMVALPLILLIPCECHPSRTFPVFFFLSLYCKPCSKCFLPCWPGESVHQIGTATFHLACFTCSVCQRPLRPGEQFSVTRDYQPLCLADVSNPPTDPVTQAKQGTQRELQIMMKLYSL